MKTETKRAATEKFGSSKCIRYMVNSTLEFLEVLHTVNAIIGAVQNRADVESIQRSSTFTVIPLPHSQSKFIACLEIPSELLGTSGIRRPLLLDYSEFDEPNKKAEIVRRFPTLLVTYPVKSLFDVNYAIYHFEASIAPLIPQAQWLRVRRSLAVAITGGEVPGVPLQMTVSVEATPALPVNRRES